MTKKLVISGNTFELFEFGNSVPYGFKRPISGKKPIKNDLIITFQKALKCSYKPPRIDNLRRTASKMKRLINANSEMKFFITLTYAKNEQDIKKANNDFKKFILKLRYYYGDFKYLAVPEFQKRGAVHFHLLCFGLPYVRKESIQRAWGEITSQSLPFTRIEAVRSRKKALVYVCKYMAKTADKTSGFNYAPYPNASQSIWTGRIWGIRGYEYLPYAEKLVCEFGRGRKTADNRRMTRVAYAIIKMRAAKQYPPIEFYPQAGFTVFCRDARGLLGVLTDYKYCTILEITSYNKD